MIGGDFAAANVQRIVRWLRQLVAEVLKATIIYGYLKKWPASTRCSQLYEVDDIHLIN